MLTVTLHWLILSAMLRSKNMIGRSIIVMGFSGSGKSTIGLKIAQQLGVKFIDGDDLHPKATILKMAAAQPLND